MSEGETKADTKPSRFTDADKIRVIEWLLKQPKPLEADTWVEAAKVISTSLDVKLAPAVLQNLTEASASLRAQVLIGATGGELSKLRDELAQQAAVIEALSTRVDAVARAAAAANDMAMRMISDLQLQIDSDRALRQETKPVGAYAGETLPGLEDDDGQSETQKET